MKHGIWASYDLGIDGDYENLFHWIDLHEGKECGDNLAYLGFEAPEDAWADLKSLRTLLQDDLREAVSIRPRDRIYAVFPTTEGTRGIFIFGSRKQPSWAGYATVEQAEIDDGAKPN